MTLTRGLSKTFDEVTFRGSNPSYRSSTDDAQSTKLFERSQCSMCAHLPSRQCVRGQQFAAPLPAPTSLILGEDLYVSHLSEFNLISGPEFSFNQRGRNMDPQDLAECGLSPYNSLRPALFGGSDQNFTVEVVKARRFSNVMPGHHPKTMLCFSPEMVRDIRCSTSLASSL